MTIITSSIKQQQLIMDFFTELFSNSFGKRFHIRDIPNKLKQTIKNNTISSSYKSCAEMLEANNIPTDNKEYKSPSLHLRS